MIRGIGGVLSSTYAQTLNGYGAMFSLVIVVAKLNISSGPFLVSRTGDEG